MICWICNSIQFFLAHFPAACKNEAKWMFGHLDISNDGLLSVSEMYDLEHDQNERCIKPFIDTCDLDKDNSLTPREWCRCFEKTDRPCAAVRRRLGNDLLGLCNYAWNRNNGKKWWYNLFGYFQVDILPIVTFLDSISPHNVTHRSVFVGALISMALNSPTHVHVENRIAVNFD